MTAAAEDLGPSRPGEEQQELFVAGLRGVTGRLR